eukprot:8573385-Pyramimonas_sp.AAC.1
MGPPACVTHHPKHCFVAPVRAPPAAPHWDRPRASRTTRYNVSWPIGGSTDDPSGTVRVRHAPLNTAFRGPYRELHRRSQWDRPHASGTTQYS